MTSKIEIAKNPIGIEGTKIHLLPVKIKANVSAKVSSFFIPRTQHKRVANPNPKVLEASFRGRELLGSLVNVPEGFIGMIAKEDKRNEGETDEENNKKLIVTRTFENFTYWRIEQEPSDEDVVARWLIWPSISKAINENNVQKRSREEEKDTEEQETPEKKQQKYSAFK